MTLPSVALTKPRTSLVIPCSTQPTRLYHLAHRMGPCSRRCPLDTLPPHGHPHIRDPYQYEHILSHAFFVGVSFLAPGTHIHLLNVAEVTLVIDAEVH